MQVDTQFPLNPGVQQPGGVMMGAGMTEGVTATSGGMAPMRAQRLQQNLIQMQRQAAAPQQIAASGYPAGAAQGQQYAMRPSPSPMHANPHMTTGQMIQAPQRAQYVQRPPRPGMMMTGAPQSPTGYQFGMNPKMSRQPPMATGGYPAGAAQLQQFYGMRPPPGPMQANPPMPMGQMMQAPQQAQYVQYPPSPGMMMASAPRPPIRYQFGMNPNMSGQPPMATGGYPAGAAQGQQYVMRPPPSPMQANPPMPMGQMMQAPQQAHYVQQSSRPGMMMPGAPWSPGQSPMGYQTGMNPIGAVAGTTAPPAPSVISTPVTPSSSLQRMDSAGTMLL